MLDSDETGEPAEGPAFRATVRGGRLHLTEWAPWLVSRSLDYGLAKKRSSATIFDLIVAGEECDELVVQPVEAGSRENVAERVLLDWAALVGYRRVWLKHEVVEVPPFLDQIGIAGVQCRSCAAKWQASGLEFWLAVREAHQFPAWCGRCGAEMSQWVVGARAEAA